jgi:hypothetical protein
MILFLGIYLKESKSAHKDSSTALFIAALFMISKLWNHPDVYQPMNR